MVTFVKTPRGIINLEHVTRVTPPEEINGEPVVYIYTSDGQSIKITGARSDHMPWAEVIYDEFCAWCVEFAGMK